MSTARLSRFWDIYATAATIFIAILYGHHFLDVIGIYLVISIILALLWVRRMS